MRFRQVRRVRDRYHNSGALTRDITARGVRGSPICPRSLGTSALAENTLVTDSLARRMGWLANWTLGITVIPSTLLETKMAFPVVAGAARFGLPVLLTRGRALAARVFGGTKGVEAVSAAARRTGITGGAQRLLGAMKNNKVMTALVLMELGTEGSELLAQMGAEDREIAEMIERYGFAPDEVKTETKADLAEQAEEMAAITEASNILGGYNQLMALRRALSLGDEHHKLYETLRQMSRVIR